MNETLAGLLNSSSPTDWLTVIIAFLSLVAFFWLMKRQIEVQRLQTNLQEQQLTIIENQEKERLKEKNRADFTAMLKRPSDDSWGGEILELKNIGPSEARYRITVGWGTTLGP